MHELLATLCITNDLPLLQDLLHHGKMNRGRVSFPPGCSTRSSPMREAPLVLLKKIKIKKCVITKLPSQPCDAHREFVVPDYLQGPYQFWRGGQDEQGNRTTRRCFVIWDVISQALRKRAIENNPTSYQGFNVGLHELQRSMQTAAHTRWVGTSSCFLQTPHSQRTPGTVQLQGGASPVITLNTPGEDFGKDSPGHDRIQKLGSTSWNISHNPRTFAIKPYGAKQKIHSAFCNV